MKDRQLIEATHKAMIDLARPDRCQVLVTDRFMPALGSWLKRCGIEWEQVGADPGRETTTICAHVQAGHRTEWMPDLATDVPIGAAHEPHAGGGRPLGRETRITFNPPQIEFEEREVVRITKTHQVAALMLGEPPDFGLEPAP